MNREEKNDTIRFTLSNYVLTGQLNRSLFGNYIRIAMTKSMGIVRYYNYCKLLHPMRK